MFCDACIHGITAALVSPRQLTPMRKPSGSPGCAGLSSFATNWSYGLLATSDGHQPLGDALSSVLLGEIRLCRPRCAADRSRRKSSARRISCRRPAAWRPVDRACRAWRRRRTREGRRPAAAGPRCPGRRVCANVASDTSAGCGTRDFARYEATRRSAGRLQPDQTTAGSAGAWSASGASHGAGAGRGGGRRSRALIDPPLQERDLLVAQRQLVERHAIADGALDPRRSSGCATSVPGRTTAPSFPPSSTSS